MRDPREHFEAVVIGSGFGGSVAACRLAEGRKSVCVLERGRAYGPGDFPRAPDQMRRNFWDPSTSRYGLFDIWSFRHLDAIVSAGLGGGSLIYANVMIRKDENWFVRDGYRGEGYEYWPVTRAALDPYYAKAETMLAGEVYPLGTSPYDTTAKTLAMQRAADRLGIKPTTHDHVDATKKQWYLPLLAVSFTADGKTEPGIPIPGRNNYHGAQRETCRLCGECDIGCNYGAKNTLDFNYLTYAQQHGAEIRTLAEATAFERKANGIGYVVTYIQHDPAAPAGTPPDVRTIETDLLVLACGTLGSNFMLLKHGESCASLSPTLGSRFSGNGDLINVAFNCVDDAKSSKARRVPLRVEGSRGPVITSTFRFPDALDHGSEAGRGFYLQDAGYPMLVDWLLEVADLPANGRRIARFARSILGRIRGRTPGPESGGDVGDVLGDGKLSSSSLTLLGMGREAADGVLKLTRRRGGKPRLDLDWEHALAQPYFSGAMRASRAVGKALGGTFVPDPLVGLLNRLVTVHPVGGCAMGRNANEGVVDSFGEVFGHQNLFVLDGSIMPGSVGANPSLTIAALAERAVDHILTRTIQVKAGTCSAR